MKTTPASYFLLGLLLFLSPACRHPAEIPIPPVTEGDKSDTALPEPGPDANAEPETVMTGTTPPPAFSSAAAPHPAPKPAPSNASRCKPLPWRAADNTAFGNQEQWDFEVRWGLVKAGEATLAVQGIEPIRNRPAYHIVMDIHATGMTQAIHPYHDRTDSWLDEAAFATVLSRHSVRESNYQADETTVFDVPCRKYEKRTRRLDKGTQEERVGVLSEEPLDIYSALFYLRSLPLLPGRTYAVPLFAGDEVVKVNAVVGAKEVLEVGAQEWDCYPIDFQTADPKALKKVKGLRWWLTADERKRPVRIRMQIPIGYMTADLVNGG
jgi:hypothetical protein